jgi:hypothetical protein
MLVWGADVGVYLFVCMSACNSPGNVTKLSTSEEFAKLKSCYLLPIIAYTESPEL